MRTNRKTILLACVITLAMTMTQGARQAPPLRAGKDSADGIAVLGYQCGVCCCSMYWRTMEIGAPPQDEAK